MKVPRLSAALVVCVLLAVLLGRERAASACCTEVICEWCVSSSDACDVPHCNILGSTNYPVCNTFGCNCNKPCRCNESNVNAPPLCIKEGCCNDRAAAAAVAAARWKEIDVNGDGKISFDEARKWIVAGRAKKSWSGHIDAPSFGVKNSTPDEKVLRAAFDRADLDHDGFIVGAEFDDLLAPPAKDQRPPTPPAKNQPPPAPPAKNQSPPALPAKNQRPPAKR